MDVEKRQVSYYSPTKGWVDREPEDAKFRATSVANSVIHAMVENTIENKAARGGWETTDPSFLAPLPAFEKGYVFEQKTVQNANGSFIKIKSQLFVDTTMLNTVLEDLALFDKHGEKFADPQLASNEFLLKVQDYQIFSVRVDKVGGKIIEAAADIQVMYNSLVKMEDIRKKMEQLCNDFRAIIQQIANGNHSNGPIISNRMHEAHTYRDQAADLRDFILGEKNTLDSLPGQVELKAYAETYYEHAENIFAVVDKLHREQKSYEIQLVSRMKELASKNLPVIETEDYNFRQLMIPLVEKYASMGYDCQLTSSGMVLRYGDVILDFGKEVKIISSADNSVQQVQTASSLKGAEASDRQI